MVSPSQAGDFVAMLDVRGLFPTNSGWEPSGTATSTSSSSTSASLGLGEGNPNTVDGKITKSIVD